MTVYKAKVDTWLIIILVGAMAGMFAPIFLVPTTEWFILWINLISAILVSWLVLDIMFHTRYIIDGNQLIVRCSILRESCRIGEITEIRETHTILSSPAPSLDRIQIKYGKYSTMVISPIEKEKFIAHLRVINPNIIIKGKDLE